jgi:hypothetical protein
MTCSDRLGIGKRCGRGHDYRAVGKRPSQSAFTLNPDGTFTYTPNTHYVGPDSFTYTWSDGLTTGNTATVTIDVYNNAPYAYDASFSVLHDRELVGQLYGYDPDGDAITAQLVSGPTNGTLTFHPDGTFTYNPNTHYVGPDSFTYTWSDGVGISNRGTVTIRVENGSPSGGADYLFDEDFILVDDVEGRLYTADRSVVDNDYDPDEDGISIVGIQGWSRYGDAYLEAEGRLWYRPTVPLDQRGASDTLTYIVSDGVSQVVASVQIMLQQPFLAEKGKKQEYKPPDVPADRIQGP